MRRVQEVVSDNRRPSALSYVIEGLVPYTRANLQLIFKPGAFFRELESRSNTKATQLQRAYYRARKQGVILYKDGEFIIDPIYLAKARLDHAKPLPYSQTMLVIYDIPEQYATRRRQLRDLLRQLDFIQIQKSVWQTDIDLLEPVLGVIDRLKLTPYVVVFVGQTTFDEHALQ